jgi:hypothetical protein
MRGIAILGLALSLSACAQIQGLLPTSEGAWFGVPTPPGLQDPPQLASPPAAPPAIVPPGDPDGPAFDGARIFADVQAITGFADEQEASGAQFWGRISGYPAASATAYWAADELQRAGVQYVQVQRFQATSEFWQPNSWEVRVLADPAFGGGTRDVVLASAVPTSGSEAAAPIEGPLVYVGEAGSPNGADVRGKIAIQHARPSTGAYSERTRIRTAAEALHEAGAIAVINWIEQAGNMHVYDFGRCGGVCFNIGGADGAFLTDVLERAGGAPVRMRLSLDAGPVSGLEAQNVIGIIPGADPRSIVVNAHLDSWFDGAGDNADGLAVLLALARHYGRPDVTPARTLVIVASGGHHSSGMNGPGAVVAMNSDLMAGADLVLNLEHVAQYQVRTDPWRVDPTEEPKSIGISNMAPFLVRTVREGAARYGYTYDTIEAGVPGDLGGYSPLGVARVQGIHSGPLYHTSGDVAASISVPGLERAARFYRYFIDEVAAAPAAAINPP